MTSSASSRSAREPMHRPTLRGLTPSGSPRPGARSARRGRWPRSWTADCRLVKETRTMWFLSRAHRQSAGRALARVSRFRPRLEILEDRTALSTLTVLNNHDSGAGSLRDTIAHAKDGDTIVF